MATLAVMQRYGHLRHLKFGGAAWSHLARLLGSPTFENSRTLKKAARGLRLSMGWEDFLASCCEPALPNRSLIEDGPYFCAQTACFCEGCLPKKILREEIGKVKGLDDGSRIRCRELLTFPRRRTALSRLGESVGSVV